MATTAKKKPARRRAKKTLTATELRALNELQELNIDQLAALHQRHPATIYRWLTVDDTKLTGSIRMPGLPPIPCHRSQENGYWRIYRTQLDKAVSA